MARMVIGIGTLIGSARCEISSSVSGCVYRFMSLPSGLNMKRRVSTATAGELVSG